MSSGEDNPLDQCKRALIRIEDAIDSINTLKYTNMDKPELWEVTDPALNQLKTYDLAVLIEYSPSLFTHH